MLSRIAPKGGVAFFVPLNRTTNPRQIFMQPSKKMDLTTEERRNVKPSLSLRVVVGIFDGMG
jgi:hypothetical protein